MKKSILIGAVALLAAGASQAAVINWGSAQNITGDTDVSALGTTVVAASFSDVGSALSNTVNGVVFVGGSSAGVKDSSAYGTALDYNVSNEHGTAFYVSDDPFGSLPSNYQTLLRSAIYNHASVLTDDFTFNNLTEGQEYQIQVWVNDPRNRTAEGAYDALDMTVDGQVTLLQNVDGTGGSPGQFVTGTFIADDTGSQAFTMSTTVDSWTVNALQLRAIPEPATLGLIAAFGGGILFVRRRLCM